MPRPTFGASLASTYAAASFETGIDYSRIVAPDSRAHAGTWASMTSSMHFGNDANGALLDAPGAFKTHFALGGSISMRDPRALATYRARWLNDGRGEGALSCACLVSSRARGWLCGCCVCSCSSLPPPPVAATTHSSLHICRCIGCGRCCPPTLPASCLSPTPWHREIARGTPLALHTRTRCRRHLTARTRLATSGAYWSRLSLFLGAYASTVTPSHHTPIPQFTRVSLRAALSTLTPSPITLSVDEGKELLRFLAAAEGGHAQVRRVPWGHPFR